MMADQLFGGKPVLHFSTGHDRRTFLKWAGLVGVGATFAAGVVPTTAQAAELKASILSSSKAAKAGTDIDILNYALTLEYLEADFYAKGLEAGFLSGRELELVTPIGDHERQHVEGVTQTINTLGGTPVAKPTITYPAGVFDSKESFYKNASIFEELGVTAYHGQVPLIQSVDILAAAASIAGVESRHAAVIATLMSANPFPNQIEKNASMDEVLAAVTPLIS